MANKQYFSDPVDKVVCSGNKVKEWYQTKYTMMCKVLKRWAMVDEKEEKRAEKSVIVGMKNDKAASQNHTLLLYSK